MRKFMAIVKKDWRLYRRTILLQAWIAIGVWLVSLVGGIIMWAVIRHHAPEADFGSPDFKMMWEQMGDLVVYVSNFYQVILPGLLGLVFAIGILIGALNSDLRNNCEIFYRSQPVSVWKRTASKYVVGLFFTLGVMLIVTLVQFVLSNLIMTFYVDGVDWGLAFVGTMQYWFYMAFGIMLSGSLAWIFSALFRDHAFFKAAGIVLGVGLLLIMINGALAAAPFLFNGWTTDFRVPDLTKLIFDYPIADMRILEVWKTNMIVNNPEELTREMLDASILDTWKLIFSVDTLVKVLVSGALFAGGALIYKRKEVL